MMGIFVITLVFAGIGMLVQSRLKSKFKQYSEVSLQNGLSGKEIAEKMLRDNNIFDVRIVSVEGQLTDHYNPSDKTVNLSPDVYQGRSVSAAAVAAHECGHAVQHAVAYSMLGFRSAMVPVLNIANNFMPIALSIGMMILYSTGNRMVLMVGVTLFALATLFSFVTLPVEFDASNRALAWMESKNVVTQTEHDGAKDALWWAAMTYVAAAVGMLAQLLYYVSMLSGRRNN
ncbi:MAG: zinc metallopeptidase [Arcicella sp.]|nr:zinc metallopeptidase [Arcicella sp.]